MGSLSNRLPRLAFQIVPDLIMVLAFPFLPGLLIQLESVCRLLSSIGFTFLFGGPARSQRTIDGLEARIRHEI